MDLADDLPSLRTPRAAEVLGISRSALYERIKRHAIAVRWT